ncbi:MAG: D-glycero-beta-D-manno-heptose-7-phosphate kinase [Deltaproteobacteria bacterium]|nr:D-glycero-beta-D-manno-heptose-7-phosphate kinase [Deltaproteobacteria bacterium]
MIREIDIYSHGEVLRRHVDDLSDTKVIVVGDILMDEYIWGDVSRISPEAPVPVVEVRQETKMLGGAANVVNNIASLGGIPILCGVIGDDQTGREIVDTMMQKGLRTDGLISEPDRPTSIKTRVVAHNQQVVRFDREKRKRLERESIKRILDFIRQMEGNYEAIIVSDYGKGVISAELMEGLRENLSDPGTLIAVDPKIGNFEFYQGVDVITPNHHEAAAFCRIEIADEESLVQAGRRMLHELNCRSVLITQGKDGMTLFEGNGEISHVPTVARKVFDVTGAGDTVISALCLGLASGMDLKSAAMIANFAAGIVVGEVGTSTVGVEDLKKAIGGRILEIAG